jgi:glutaredoxin 3
VANLELYGTAGCPYTREMREWLQWRGEKFVEFDVEQDLEALDRLYALAPAPYCVPVLVKDGKVIALGWRGRSCAVARK